MAFTVVYFLMAVLCAATLLHAGVISDDDNESETDAPTTSVVSDESTEAPDDYFLDELGFRRKRSAGGVDSLKTAAANSTNIGDQKDAVASPAAVPDHSRARREDKSKKAGGKPSVPATANENQGTVTRLSTVPENSRTVRAAQGQGSDAWVPRAPWITNRQFLMRPASAADDGPSARALQRETRGAAVLTSHKSAPASVSTGNRSKVASPAADSKKTPSAPASGKKLTSAQ